MKYERLTTKCEVGIGICETSGNIVEDYEKVVTRLAELEDKIESGLLVELPCNVGDPANKEYKEYGLCKAGFNDCPYNIGSAIFTTLEAVKAKLKELRGGGKND